MVSVKTKLNVTYFNIFICLFACYKMGNFCPFCISR